MPEARADLNIRTEGDVRLVSFADRKILEEVQIQQISERLEELILEDARPRIILDFSGVEHLSSAALSVLISVKKLVAEREGKLVLTNIQAQIFEVFKITRLNRLFEVRDSNQEALESF